MTKIVRGASGIIFGAFEVGPTGLVGSSTGEIFVSFTRGIVANLRFGMTGLGNDFLGRASATAISVFAALIS
jgi:hypothetical protein